MDHPSNDKLAYESSMSHESYSSVGWMVLFSVIVNYIILSNVMLTFQNGIYNYLNKLYMSLLMGAVMAIIMILIMIFESHKLTSTSLIIIIISLLSSIVLIILIRDQTFVYQASFSKSMIEHHDMAILMSDQILNKPGQSPAVYELANTIIISQQAEIDLMQSWLHNGFPS